MQISQKTEYALKTVLDLAQHAADEIVSSASIAKRQDIPVRFLEQILIGLKGAGLIASKRGPKGGYHLSRPASEITVGMIVRLTEINAAAVAPNGAHSQAHCPFTEIWKEIEGHIHETLEGVTIQDMCNRAAEHAASQKNAYVI